MPATGIVEGVALDRVTLFLAVVTVISVAGLGFVGFSPNRILTPQSIALWNAGALSEALAMGAGAILMLAGSLWHHRATGERVTLAGATLLLVADFAAAGVAASALVSAASSP